METLEIAKLWSREAPVHATLEYHVQDLRQALKLAERLGQHWHQLGGGYGPKVGQSDDWVAWEYPKLMVIVNYNPETVDECRARIHSEPDP